MEPSDVPPYWTERLQRYFERVRYLKALRGDPYDITWGIQELGPPPQGFLIIGNPPPGALDEFYHKELLRKPFRPVNRVDTISEIYMPSPGDVPDTVQPARPQAPVRKTGGRNKLPRGHLEDVERLLQKTIREIVHESKIRPSSSQVFVAWPGHNYHKRHPMHLEQGAFNLRVKRIMEWHGYTDWYDYVEHVLSQ